MGAAGKEPGLGASAEQNKKKKGVALALVHFVTRLGANGSKWGTGWQRVRARTTFIKKKTQKGGAVLSAAEEGAETDAQSLLRLRRTVGPRGGGAACGSRGHASGVAGAVAGAARARRAVHAPVAAALQGA